MVPEISVNAFVVASIMSPASGKFSLPLSELTSPIAKCCVEVFPYPSTLAVAQPALFFVLTFKPAVTSAALFDAKAPVPVAFKTAVPLYPS